MYKYLFVCNENIGRSQMAEGFYNAKSSKKYSINAGVIDSARKYNGHPRPDIIQVMKEVGIDISNQKIKQLTSKMLGKVENIVVLCDRKLCPSTITNKRNVTYIPVNDPPGRR